MSSNVKKRNADGCAAKCKIRSLRFENEDENERSCVRSVHVRSETMKHKLKITVSMTTIIHTVFLNASI